MRTGWVVALTAVALASGAFYWMGYGGWQGDGLTPVSLPRAGIAMDASGRVEIRYADAVVAGSVATYRDELFAYLMYQQYRGAAAYAGREVLLYRAKEGGEVRYRVVLELGTEVLAAVGEAVARSARGEMEAVGWFVVPRQEWERYRKQTSFLDRAYQLPVKRKLEELSAKELKGFLRRFLRFKSSTDPRVRNQIEPVPEVLEVEEAHVLAGDILAIAEFYELPLELLLGIGAMENNYMNVRGDLRHSIWKRKPAKDDIVIERRRGRYRVLNDSAGVWQITRETLRYAHRLYQRDKRDYSQLPEHLRPKKELDVNEVDVAVLTTYAGLLLRDLLDRFAGDVPRAIGAYNGGPGNPNLRYYEGVKAAAEHARRILEQAAALNGESAMEKSWWMGR